MMPKFAVLVVAAMLFSASAGVAAAASPSEEFQAVTKPSQDVTLTFSHPAGGSGSGKVAELLVHEGDEVKAGQLVARQDDTEEQASLDVAQAQAQDNTRVEAQKKVLAQKKKVYENKVASHAANQTEIDEAELDWQVAIANVALSEFEHQQDIRKAAQAKAILEKTRLRTPISGIVAQTMLKAGESIDGQNDKVLRIVALDPLWVEVPVRFSVARDLKDGAAASVTFSNNEVRTGKVVFVAPVADAASDTLMVRVEVGNVAKTPAGERVKVSFPGAAKAVAEQ